MKNNKLKGKDLINIMGIMVGVFLCVTGMGAWPIVFGIIFGALADLIAKSGNYASQWINSTLL